MTLFDLTQRDQKNNGLKDQLWFFLFVGADMKEIEGLRAKSKRQEVEICALQVSDYSQSLGNAHSPGLTQPPITEIPGQSKPNIQRIYDPQIPSARAHNAQDTRSETNASAANTGRYSKTSLTLDVYTLGYSARAIAPVEHSRRTHHEKTHGRSFRVEAEHVQANKGHAVELYFRDKMFTGAPDQAVENLTWDFHTCAVQQSLDST